MWHADRGRLLLRTIGRTLLGLSYVSEHVVIFPDYALRIFFDTFSILLYNIDHLRILGIAPSSIVHCNCCQINNPLYVSSRGVTIYRYIDMSQYTKNLYRIAIRNLYGDISQFFLPQPLHTLSKLYDVLVGCVALPLF